MPIKVICSKESCSTITEATGDVFDQRGPNCGSLMLPLHEDEQALLKPLPKGLSGSGGFAVRATLAHRPSIDAPSNGMVDVLPPSGPTTGERKQVQTADLRTPFVGSYGEDDQCKICKNKETHLLPLGVSWITQGTCARIAEGCRLADQQGKSVYKSGQAKRGFMIGVLEASNELLVAMSGQLTTSGFKRVIDSRRLKAVVERVTLIQELPTRISAGGAKIDSIWCREVKDRTPAGLFECAAPKLIHYAQCIICYACPKQRNSIATCPGQ